jgi:hypothetical protein
MERAGVLTVLYTQCIYTYVNILRYYLGITYQHSLKNILGSENCSDISNIETSLGGGMFDMLFTFTTQTIKIKKS